MQLYIQASAQRAHILCYDTGTSSGCPAHLSDKHDFGIGHSGTQKLDNVTVPQGIQDVDNEASKERHTSCCSTSSSSGCQAHLSDKHDLVVGHSGPKELDDVDVAHDFQHVGKEAILARFELCSSSGGGLAHLGDEHDLVVGHSGTQELDDVDVPHGAQ